MLRVETRGARARKNERARFNYVEILNNLNSCRSSDCFEIGNLSTHGVVVDDDDSSRSSRSDSHSKRSKMSSGRNKGCEYNNKNTKSSGDMTKRRKRALLAKNSFCRFSLFLRLRLRLLHRDLFITVCNTSC